MRMARAKPRFLVDLRSARGHRRRGGPFFDGARAGSGTSLRGAGRRLVDKAKKPNAPALFHAKPANVAFGSHSRRLCHVFLKLAGGAALGLATTGSSFAAPPKLPPKAENVLSPDAALARLMKENQRYVEGISKRHDFKHEREALTKGQNPYAGVLSCADSRIAPEYAFDAGRGDLFVCRVAGNFINDDVIASFEYAVSVLNHRSSSSLATRRVALSRQPSNRSRAAPPSRGICRRLSPLSRLRSMQHAISQAISSTMQLDRTLSPPSPG
jgi:hypothetical protein